MSIAAVLDYDPTRDSRHRKARSARELADWLAWLELGGTAPRTLADYEWIVARALRMFPSKAFDEFTDGDLIHVFKTFPQAGRRTKVAAFASWFKWGMRTKRIERNPMDTLPVIRQPRQPVIDVFSEAEVEAILALPLIDAAPLAVLLEGGLRKAEARHLRLGRCLPESGQIAVVEGAKGGAQRVVPMSARLRSLLSDLTLIEGLERSDHVFYSVRANATARRVIRGNPVGEGTFARWWERCLGEAGVRYRKPHTARHTYATTWRRRGLAVDEIQLLLGHASASTTSDLYVHTKITDVAEHMALIEAGSPERLA